MTSALPGTTVSRTFPAHSATGGLSNFDATPAGVLVVNGVDSAEVVTLTQITMGIYRYQATLPVGWDEGDAWEVRVTGAIGGITAAGIVDAGIIVARLPGDQPTAADTAAAVNSALSAAHGAGSWTGGAGGSVTITPITSTVGPGDVSRSHFKAFTGSAGSITITVVDATGSAVDLTAATIDFVARHPRGPNVFAAATDDDPPAVVAGGAAGNEITIAWPLATFTAPGILEYALRQRNTGFPWALGTIDVEEIPAVS